MYLKFKRFYKFDMMEMNFHKRNIEIWLTAVTCKKKLLPGPLFENDLTL